MTAIFSTSNFFSFNASNEAGLYIIEVITFEGDSITFEIEAGSSEEACEIATSQVENADYAMVQGVA